MVYASIPEDAEAEAAWSRPARFVGATLTAALLFGAAVFRRPAPAVGALVSKRSYHGNTSAKSGAFESDSCRLYKRTFASADASADAAVVSKALGLDFLDNITYTRDGGSEVCAHRELLQTNGEEVFGLHFFTSEITEYGDVSPAQFADAATVSIEAAFDGGAWSQWALPAVTFYAASLEPFLSAWADIDGLTYSLASYASPLDGETLYNVFLLLPSSGTTLRVVAPHAGNFQASCASMTTDMCAESLFVNQTVVEMKAHLVALKRRRLAAAAADAAAYPDLLVVEVAAPAGPTAIDAIPRFMKEFAKATTAYDTFARTSGGANCSWTSFEFEVCGMAEDGDQCSADDGWAVAVKSVHNAGASHGAYSPQYYGEYVSGVHTALTGCNTGWDRFLDSHLGVWCTKPRYLDNIGPKLCGNGVGYHAHAGDNSAGSAIEGSLWSAGAAGLGIEFHGYFNGRFFNETALTDLDYCTKSSTGDCRDMQC